MRPRIILSGISGSGKTTLGKCLEQEGYQKIPNVTTRTPRLGESEKDYIFVDEETFAQWRDQQRFAFTRITNGVWHGLLKESVDLLKENKGRYRLDKSVPAARELATILSPERVTFIYLLAPSFGILRERIGSRSSHESDEALFARFREEIGEMLESHSLSYAYVVNDSIERMMRELRDIL